MYGKNVWMIADGYMSDTVKGEYVSHEAICVLNVSGKDANINITLYFENDEPMKNNRPRVHHAACCRIFLGYFLKESMLPPVYIAVKDHRNPIQRKMSGY